MDITKTAYLSRGGVATHDKDTLRGGEAYCMETYLHGKILDLGCGTGRTTAHLARTCTVVGIDYSKSMIARAREKHPTIDFRVMDVRSLAFPDGSFDGALFSFNGIDYLYPFRERILALREIRRVVKKGGVFIYTSHTLRRRYPRNLRQLIAHVVMILYRIRAPYTITFPSYGFLITYCEEPAIQARILASEGFSVLEHFPVKDGEEMFITRV